MKRDDGWLRRDALKTLAMMAAPLTAQTHGPGRGSAIGSQAVVAPGKRNQPFDEGWRFLREDASGAEQPGFDDATWRTLDLPHDFSIEDLPPRPFDANGEGSQWGGTPTPIRVGPFDTELSPGAMFGWFVGGY